MKRILNKNELIFVGGSEYKSPNKNVLTAIIAEYTYSSEQLYQPQIQDKHGKLIIDHCSYIQRIEAEKAIDNYKNI